MYKRYAQGWSKHLDFFIADEISLQLAFVLAAYFRLSYIPYSSFLYRNLGLVLLLIDAIVLMLFNTMHDVLKRGYFKEFIITLQHCAFVFALSTAYLFLTQFGDSYSRIALSLTFFFHIVIGYLTRIIWKAIVKARGFWAGRKGTILAVLNPEGAEAILQYLIDHNQEGYRWTGVVFTEESEIKEVSGLPVVCGIQEASKYIAHNWIDAVYIDASFNDPNVIKLMNDCHEMAVPVHYHVRSLGRSGGKQFVERIGGTYVLTTSINYATPVQLLMKRLLDILGGIVGSVIAVIIVIVIGPIIKIKSPGPVFYTQERIGQNGRKFRIIKIRSMYLDADERKKELMNQNRIKGGRMFKLDFDPRIIGNEILPDGTRKTGIGEFIRKTSLDEFPQFFNVLVGSMSLVGTRPPTVDEWEKYEFHHHARLSCKPGITGMWQVSGRSNITDFEEVVKLDTEYITNWSMALDLKILFKTIIVLFRRTGAM